jgi:hypothetical protein
LRLAGAAAKIRATIGEPGTPDRQTRLARRLAPARAMLGEEASADAWEAGRAMTLEQAAADALKVSGD